MGTTTGRKFLTGIFLLVLVLNVTHFHDHLKLAHYANAACDIEFRFLLIQKNLKVFTHEQILTCLITKNIPEKNCATSIQSKTHHIFLMWWKQTLDSTDFFCSPQQCLQWETLNDGSAAYVLNIPPFLAPIKCAVFTAAEKRRTA